MVKVSVVASAATLSDPAGKKPGAGLQAFSLVLDLAHTIYVQASTSAAALLAGCSAQAFHAPLLTYQAESRAQTQR